MTTTTPEHPRRRASDKAAPHRTDNRRRMPSERDSITHKFKVGEFELYLTVGLYADGTPGEVFLRGSKVGSSVHGFTETFSILFSMALQAGVPLAAIVGKFRNVHFEPCDDVDIPGIREGGAPSIPAYVVRWMERKFLLDPNGPAVVKADVAVKARPSGRKKK